MELVLAHGLESGSGWPFERSDEFAPTEAFGAAAVVLQEEDEGVVELLVLFESGDNAADALIHIVDHGGVDFHASGLPFLQFNFIPIADGAGNSPVGIDEAEGFHLLEAGFVDGLVAFVILALILGDVFGKRVHGPVRRGVGDVVEEGLSGVLLEV